MSSRDRPRAGELAEIRKDLREMRFYVEDLALRSEVNDWIERSLKESDADTAREYVERKLNELLAQNPMYHAPHLERGEDAFPDVCSECRHYGSACPVLRDNVEVQWRDRKLEAASNEEEARRVYQQQAIDVSCRVIPRLLGEWDNRHSDFVRKGEELLNRLEESIRDDVDDVDDLEENPLKAIADGGDR